VSPVNGYLAKALQIAYSDQCGLGLSIAQLIATNPGSELLLEYRQCITTIANQALRSLTERGPPSVRRMPCSAYEIERRPIS